MSRHNHKGEDTDRDPGVEGECKDDDDDDDKNECKNENDDDGEEDEENCEAANEDGDKDEDFSTLPSVVAAKRNGAAGYAESKQKRDLVEGLERCLGEVCRNPCAD